jgi:acyl carrier protein
MDIKEFIENFAGELDETALEDLTPDTELKTLEEWSSLVALSIIAMIDDNYEKEITGDDLRSCKTLQDLCNLVESK